MPLGLGLDVPGGAARSRGRHHCPLLAPRIPRRVGGSQGVAAPSSSSSSSSSTSAATGGQHRHDPRLSRSAASQGGGEPRHSTVPTRGVPAALPVFLGGLKVGATLAVIGAVVGEFVAADQGLGFLINLGRGLYDTALVFVAIFALVSMAMLLYGAVALLESRLLSWQRKG